MVMVSAYALIPVSRQSVMRQYLKTSTGERVMYKHHPAWMIELPALRQVQLEWARTKHGKPTVEKCLHLIGLASGNLGRPLPVKGFTWKESFWREELCRLKVAAVRWLAEAEGTRVRHAWLNVAAVGWLGQTPITVDEARFAVNLPRELVPVLITDTVAAAMPALTDAWEGAPIVEQVPNETNREGRRQSAETIAAKLWNYLPEPSDDLTIPDIVSSVQSWSVSWPGNELWLQRNSNGQHSMPDWLKELPNRQMPY